MLPTTRFIVTQTLSGKKMDTALYHANPWFSPGNPVVECSPIMFSEAVQTQVKNGVLFLVAETAACSVDLVCGLTVAREV